ncbi:MAG: glycosyltransferase family 4 protein [Clostridiales bacterium]|nr:glycosyltransferase family 4 protein [Clostridiales bacterium]
MNIWIVNHYAIPPSMGGLVRHYYFSKYLQKKGHTVKIFTSSKIHNTDINMIKDKSLYREEMEDGVEYTFVRSRDYKGNGLDRIFNMMDLPFKTWKTMKMFYKKQKPDVIYTSSPDLFVAYFALLFGRKYKIPVVVEVRDLWPESIVVYNKISRRNPIILLLYQLEKWIYKRADRIIFTMAGGADYITEKRWSKKIDLKKIYHVNNGVDMDEFEYNRIHFTLKDELLEDDEHFNIVYAGSIRRANGLDKLVEVAEYIQNMGETNVRFLIYGDGSDKDKLEQHCRDKAIKNICFRGKVEKRYVPFILSKGKVNFMHGISTSIMKYGCSPNKLFDYIASGKPIVSDLAAKYDLITEYDLGIMLNKPETEKIAEAFIHILKNYDELSVRTEKNSRKAVEEYDYKVLTDKLERILIF